MSTIKCEDVALLSVQLKEMVTSNGLEETSPNLIESNRKPTEVADRHWIHVTNKTNQNNRIPNYATHKTYCGKWLIFEPCDKIDATWAIIKQETEKGELGFASKVSTMKDKDTRMNDSFVICAYTYNHTDEEDVMRVRERLRELGFVRKLPYKTDEATLAGQYRATSKKRVSKWFC